MEYDEVTLQAGPLPAAESEAFAGPRSRTETQDQPKKAQNFAVGQGQNGTTAADQPKDLPIESAAAVVRDALETPITDP